MLLCSFGCLDKCIYVKFCKKISQTNKVVILNFNWNNTFPHILFVELVHTIYYPENLLCFERYYSCNHEKLFHMRDWQPSNLHCNAYMKVIKVGLYDGPLKSYKNELYRFIYYKFVLNHLTHGLFDHDYMKTFSIQAFYVFSDLIEARDPGARHTRWNVKFPL